MGETGRFTSIFSIHATMEWISRHFFKTFPRFATPPTDLQQLSYSFAHDEQLS